MPDDTSSWGTGTSITCEIASSLDSHDPTDVNCVGGNSTDLCPMTYKVCVTCRKISSQVYIRVQSNGIPKHCYGTTEDGGEYPNQRHIDFEVKWNQFRVGDYNYIETQIDQESEVDGLLCNRSVTSSLNMFSDSGYTEVSGSDNLDYISGYAFDNISILNALTPGGNDALQYNIEYEQTLDQCL